MRLLDAFRSLAARHLSCDWLFLIGYQTIEHILCEFRKYSDARGQLRLKQGDATYRLLVENFAKRHKLPLPDTPVQRPKRPIDADAADLGLYADAPWWLPET